jgi:hypothetical protein
MYPLEYYQKSPEYTRSRIKFDKKENKMFNLFKKEKIEIKKGNIFCNKCKYLQPYIRICDHEDNKKYYKTPLQEEYDFINDYKDINKNNDCKWFENINKPPQSPAKPKGRKKMKDTEKEIEVKQILDEIETTLDSDEAWQITVKNQLSNIFKEIEFSSRVMGKYGKLIHFDEISRDTYNALIELGYKFKENYGLKESYYYMSWNKENKTEQEDKKEKKKSPIDKSMIIMKVCFWIMGICVVINIVFAIFRAIYIK